MMYAFQENYVYIKWQNIFHDLYCNITGKAMAPHSSTLAWKIPWTEEPTTLQSMGLLRVGHDWATSLSLFTFMHCRRKWQPTPVFLPGESQGRGILVGCHLWGRRVGHDWSYAAAAAAAAAAACLLPVTSLLKPAINLDLSFDVDNKIRDPLLFRLDS